MSPTIYYENMNNMKAKLILLFSEERYSGNYDKEKLLHAFKNAQENQVFKSITDSVTWQNKLRNEWE